MSVITTTQCKQTFNYSNSSIIISEPQIILNDIERIKQIINQYWEHHKVGKKYEFDVPCVITYIKDKGNKGDTIKKDYIKLQKSLLEETSSTVYKPPHRRGLDVKGEKMDSTIFDTRSPILYYVNIFRDTKIDELENYRKTKNKYPYYFYLYFSNSIKSVLSTMSINQFGNKYSDLYFRDEDITIVPNDEENIDKYQTIDIDKYLYTFNCFFNDDQFSQLVDKKIQSGVLKYIILDSTQQEQPYKYKNIFSLGETNQQIFDFLTKIKTKILEYFKPIDEKYIKLFIKHNNNLQYIYITIYIYNNKKNIMLVSNNRVYIELDLYLRILSHPENSEKLNFFISVNGDDELATLMGQPIRIWKYEKKHIPNPPARDNIDILIEKFKTTHITEILSYDSKKTDHFHCSKSIKIKFSDNSEGELLLQINRYVDNEFGILKKKLDSNEKKISFGNIEKHYIEIKSKISLYFIQKESIATLRDDAKIISHKKQVLFNNLDILVLITLYFYAYFRKYGYEKFYAKYYLLLEKINSIPILQVNLIDLIYLKQSINSKNFIGFHRYTGVGLNDALCEIYRDQQSYDNYLDKLLKYKYYCILFHVPENFISELYKNPNTLETNPEEFDTNLSMLINTVSEIHTRFNQTNFMQETKLKITDIFDKLQEFKQILKKDERIIKLINELFSPAKFKEIYTKYTSLEDGPAFNFITPDEKEELYQNIFSKQSNVNSIEIESSKTIGPSFQMFHLHMLLEAKTTYRGIINNYRDIRHPKLPYSIISDYTKL